MLQPHSCLRLPRPIRTTPRARLASRSSKTTRTTHQRPHFLPHKPQIRISPSHQPFAPAAPHHPPPGPSTPPSLPAPTPLSHMPSVPALPLPYARPAPASCPPDRKRAKPRAVRHTRPAARNSRLLVWNTTCFPHASQPPPLHKAAVRSSLAGPGRRLCSLLPVLRTMHWQRCHGRLIDRAAPLPPPPPHHRTAAPLDHGCICLMRPVTPGAAAWPRFHARMCPLQRLARCCTLAET